MENKYSNYGSILKGDCLELLKNVPDQSIDMILCDLPYGTTSCSWDSLIDLDKLWKEYKRVIKPYKAIILTASQPFTTTVISSNIIVLKSPDIISEKSILIFCTLDFISPFR